ncbi:MAG: UDP-N-acetylmuramate--L-alanine ligase [Caldilineales bacterium]|nr:UDP-N-acetylmuramate--L-alanine ligase [Caldilineales bacterium]
MDWFELFQLAPEARRRHRFHLIGIGGAGLGPIAQVLLEMGFQVSGSDQAASPRTEALAAAGARVHVGHAAGHLYAEEAPHRPDAVLISAAVPPTNPEVMAAQAAGIPVIRRRDLLGPLTAGRRVIAVAGTHGKTTTTAMIAHILTGVGLAPGYIIGSEMPGLGAGALGRGPHFVIEADEYDEAFLGLAPTVIVLTNIDWDHPDYFRTPAAYADAFRRFVGRLQPGGRLIYCQDDAETEALVASIPPEALPAAQRLGYGSRSRAVWQARFIEIGPDQTTYELRSPNGAAWPVRLRVPGLHNVLNSVAALLVAQTVGVSVPTAAPFLASFGGAVRRFQVKGEAGGVLIIDDYAHHPTEVRTTLAAARAAYPDRTIWAVYQPHTYSRTRILLEQFDGVFAAADHVLVTDIYPAREPPDPSVTSAQVVAASRHRHARASGSLEATLALLVAEVQPPAVVVILSAGDATRLATDLLRRLGHG